MKKLSTDIDLLKFMASHMGMKKCPWCKSPLPAPKIRQTVKEVHVTRTHFCSFMNGDCKVSQTYRKNKHEPKTRDRVQKARR